MTEQDLLNALRNAQQGITEAWHHMDDQNVGLAKLKLQDVGLACEQAIYKWHESHESTREV